MDFAVREHAEGGQDLRRQTRELRGLPGRVLGIRRAARHAEQHLQCMPARGQRRVQINGAQESLDGRLRGTHRHMAMATFLEQSTIVRVAPFQFGKRRQRFGNALQVPQADCHHVQHVAIRGNLRAQRLGSRQRRPELAALEELAYAPTSVSIGDGGALRVASSMSLAKRQRIDRVRFSCADHIPSRPGAVATYQRVGEASPDHIAQSRPRPPATSSRTPIPFSGPECFARTFDCGGTRDIQKGAGVYR